MEGLAGEREQCFHNPFVGHSQKFFHHHSDFQMVINFILASIGQTMLRHSMTDRCVEFRVGLFFFFFFETTHLACRDTMSLMYTCFLRNISLSSSIVGVILVIPRTNSYTSRHARAFAFSSLTSLRSVALRDSTLKWNKDCLKQKFKDFHSKWKASDEFANEPTGKENQ